MKQGALLEFIKETIGKNVIHYKLVHSKDHKPVTHTDGFTLMHSSGAYAENFRGLLRKQFLTCPFEYYNWYCPPMTWSAANSRPFEFVLVRSAKQARFYAPDKKFYEEHLRKSNDQEDFIVNYYGLKTALIDSLVIMPKPKYTGRAKKLIDYSQLSSFMRNASPKETKDLFKLIGKLVMHNMLLRVPIWLGTCKNSHSWLHVRLDFGRVSTGCNEYYDYLSALFKI
jgi:hypothetical protein